MVRNASPQEWRKKVADKKRVEKVVTLRKYAKLCKKEGIQSSRFRTEGSEPDGQSSKPKPQKPKKKAPAVEKVESVEDKQKAKKEHAKEQLKSIEEALHRRKEKRKLATATNSKGQPVFKGKIFGILEKLQK